MSQSVIETGVGITDLTFEMNGSFLNESTHPDVSESQLRSRTGEAAVSTLSKCDANEVRVVQNHGVNDESLAMVIEMSQIFNTKLSPEALKLCLSLVNNGVDHIELAQLLKNWRLKKYPQLDLSESSLPKHEWKT